MTLLKFSIGLMLLISAACTSANELGLSADQLNNLLNLETVQPKKQEKKGVNKSAPTKVVTPTAAAVAKPKASPKLVKSKRISCKSFNNQFEAQQHFDLKRKSWKALDRDKDGEPCECLKGGSRYGESICKRWRKKSDKK